MFFTAFKNGAVSATPLEVAFGQSYRIGLTYHSRPQNLHETLAYFQIILLDNYQEQTRCRLVLELYEPSLVDETARYALLDKAIELIYNRFDLCQITVPADSYWLPLLARRKFAVVSSKQGFKTLVRRRG